MLKLKSEFMVEADSNEINIEKIRKEIKDLDKDIEAK